MVAALSAAEVPRYREIISTLITQWRCSVSEHARAGASEASEARATHNPPATFSPGHGTTQPIAQAAPCPEAEALERERDALAGATENVRTIAKDVFFGSAPNPTLENRLAPIVDEIVGRPGRCDYSFQCRGLACQIILMVPESITKAKGFWQYECFDGAAWVKHHLRVVGDRLENEYGGFTVDAVSRASFKKIDLYFRLANEQAEPIPPEERKPARLPPGWDRERGPIPVRLAPACRKRVVRARNELAMLARQITRTMEPYDVFAQSTPRPELARELADLLRPHLAVAGKPLPVEIECRGSLCSLRSREDIEGSAVRWSCPKNGGICWGRWDDGGWFGRLLGKRMQLALEHVIPLGIGGARRGVLYVTFIYRRLRATARCANGA